jgi:sialate O-acetylesterase
MRRAKSEGLLQPRSYLEADVTKASYAEFPIDDRAAFLWTWRMKKFLLVPLLSVVFVALAAQAEVRLPALFSDNMVLQQRMDAPVWGWADDGEEVKVSFRGKTVKAKAKNGKWMVKLGKLKAGGPNSLVVEGKNRIELKNVLVGEVWVCSGQSNMELALNSASGGKEEIARSGNPQLRLFKVGRKKANEPMNDVQADWKDAGPESTAGFSAVAYYFGRDLQKALNVPVGLIDTCWGGSPVEVWMSERVLSSNPEYKRDILDAYTATL